MILLQTIIDAIQIDPSKLPAGRVANIRTDLRAMIGSDDLAISEEEIGKLRTRYSTWLKSTGLTPKTANNKSYRLGLLLDMAVQQGLLPAPDEGCSANFPILSRPPEGPELRRFLAMKRFEKWCYDQELDFLHITPDSLLNYREFLKVKYPKGCTAEVLYDDLSRLWREQVKKSNFPHLEIPSWRNDSATRYGIIRESWPRKMKNDFLRFEEAASSKAIDNPDHYHRVVGKASIHSTEQLIVQMLGYLTQEERVPIHDLGLRDLLGNDTFVKGYIAWHIRARCAGQERHYHRDQLRRIGNILEWLGNRHSADKVRQLAKGLKPQRVKAPFLPQPITYPTLVAAVQRALKDALARWNCVKTSSNRKELISAACFFRDAVALALLVLRPIRSRNVCEMKHGINLLYRERHGWVLHYAKEEMKTSEHTSAFPKQLDEYLAILLREIVPVLSKKKETNLCFPTRTGKQLRGSDLWKRLTKMGETYLGLATNPHMFRSLVACAYVLDHPDRWRDIQALLGHATLEVTLRHYMFVYSQVSSRKVAQVQREHCEELRAIGSLLPFSH